MSQPKTVCKKVVIILKGADGDYDSDIVESLSEAVHLIEQGHISGSGYAKDRAFRFEVSEVKAVSTEYIH